MNKYEKSLQMLFITDQKSVINRLNLYKYIEQVLSLLKKPFNLEIGL